MAASLQEQFALFFNVLGRLRPLAIVLVGSALIATIAAGNQIARAVAAYNKSQAILGEASAKIRLARQPLAAEDYTRYGGVLTGLVPGVRVTVSEGGRSMRLSINNVAAFELWIYALSSLQSYSKNVVWEATAICLQECGGEAVATADIQGYIQTAEFEQ